MQINFGYGTREQPVIVPDEQLLAVLTANEMEHTRTGSEAVIYALENPIGAPPLRTLVRPGQKIAIVASDISRPVPSYEILPEILKELFAAGCKTEDITVVFALGSHRKHTEEEMRHLAGDEAFETVRCVDSDPDDCVHMGVTDAGTPVDITRVVAEADFRICTGNIEFHYFAGYSGGAKAVMPGVSTPVAIQANHRMMINEAACAGKLEGNGSAVSGSRRTDKGMTVQFVKYFVHQCGQNLFAISFADIFGPQSNSGILINTGR